MDWTQILVAGIPSLISSVASILAVIVKIKGTNKKIENLHNSNEQSQIRSEMNQLIMEDEMAVMRGELPMNYKNVMALYDYYDSKHWNTYIHRKVDNYEKWYNDLINSTKSQLKNV